MKKQTKKQTFPSLVVFKENNIRLFWLFGVIRQYRNQKRRKKKKKKKKKK